MPTTCPHLIPVPRHAVPAPPPGPPCTAWSVHAAVLAADVAGLVPEWGWTPTAQALEAEGQLVQLLPGIFAPPDRLDSPIDRVISLGCAIGSRLRPDHVVAGASAAWGKGSGPPTAPAQAPATVPARTAAELLRFERAPDSLDPVGRLVDEGHVTAERVSARLAAMHRHPGSRAAGARLVHVLAARSARAA